MKWSDVMRLWHYALLPYLPEAQFKGQLRELVAIMHDWRDKGQTNHLLINKVMDYPKQELSTYFMLYRAWYKERYNKWLDDNEFEHFAEPISIHEIHERKGVYIGWHNKEYLCVCMANLYEKWKFGKGKSRITDEEWERLCDGYKEITGDEYVICNIMININKLKHILNSCVMLPNYKALIVVSGFVKAKYIKNFIIENYGNNISDLYSIQENHVIFNNGSIIYVIPNNYPFLGLRVNELLYDEIITQDVIKTIYEPMYIPYFYPKEKEE